MRERWEHGLAIAMPWVVPDFNTTEISFQILSRLFSGVFYPIINSILPTPTANAFREARQKRKTKVRNPRLLRRRIIVHSSCYSTFSTG